VVPQVTASTLASPPALPSEVTDASSPPSFPVDASLPAAALPVVAFPPPFPLEPGAPLAPEAEAPLAPVADCPLAAPVVPAEAPDDVFAPEPEVAPELPPDAPLPVVADAPPVDSPAAAPAADPADPPDAPDIAPLVLPDVGPADAGPDVLLPHATTTAADKATMPDRLRRTEQTPDWRKLRMGWPLPPSCRRGKPSAGGEGAIVTRP